ncbi:hypothetical protein F2Q68_00038212 [Brassica cretica]|uniref:Uncharacterized protein n=1 Tax=Brassica cretica TaxID=69181 RepID=A0A8S9MKW4_BRACR|nr:hypothetical protein F2Q68_00038212 [Brassica cretica]
MTHYPHHLLHCEVGLVFCGPALSGHSVCNGGTMQLYCKHSELLTGISSAGLICIPVRKLCCRYNVCMLADNSLSAKLVGTSPLNRFERSGYI